MVLESFIFYVITALLVNLLAPTPEQEGAKQAKFGDFKFPTADKNRVIPIIFGTPRLEAPNVVWYGDLKAKPITQEVGGSLFGGGDDVTVGYRYFLGVQMALCRGPIDAILKIRVGEEEVFSGTQVSGDLQIKKPNLFGGNELGNGGINGNLEVFDGSKTQAASDYLADFQSVGGVTPAYRGTCYVVLEQFYLGNSTSIAPWSFDVRRIPTQLGSANSAVNGGRDANLAHVAYELLTDIEWGLSQPVADIEDSTFTAAAATFALEGNGISLALEREIEAVDLLKLIEDQGDCVVDINPATGKWEMRLARADYVLGDQQELTSDNVLVVDAFSRGSWDETYNYLTLDFKDADDEYADTAAIAQSSGNQQIQQRVAATQVKMPGVVDGTLANNLAQRELSRLSRPLVRATLTVNREFYGTRVLDVLRWSGTVGDQSFTDLALRVTNVSYDQISSGEIKIEAFEDVFAAAVAGFGDPFGTGWTPPSDVLVGLPSTEQVVIEAPRGFLIRAPGYTEDTEADRVWCGFRQQTGEAGATIYARSAPSSPSGDFEVVGFVTLVFEIGLLTSALPRTSGATTTFTVTPDSGSTQDDIIDVVLSGATTLDQGENLRNLVFVGGEFMLVTSATANGTDVDLEGVTRGVLDSVQQDHAVSARVYMLSAGGALTDSSFDSQYELDVRLATDSLAAAAPLDVDDATNVDVVLDDRRLRPYAPSRMLLNGSEFPSSTVSLDDVLPSGSGLDGSGLRVQYTRRDFRTTNEVASYLSESALPADFPANNSTEYRVRVYVDPSTALTLIITKDFGEVTNDLSITRAELIATNSGTVPDEIRVSVTARHTVDVTVYESTVDAVHDFDTSSVALDALFELGALDDSDVSASYTAAETGTYTVEVGTDLLTSGDLEYRLNSGSWTTLIDGSTSDTTGSINGVTVTDEIELRHTQTGSNDSYTLLVLTDPSAVDVAQAALIV